MQKSSNWHLVAMLGHAARCLRGDVLWDRHGGHGLQRRRVRSGEAAAHALVDGTIPGEAAVLCQRALLTAHWRERIQSSKSKAINHRARVEHVRLKAQTAIKSSGCTFLVNVWGNLTVWFRKVGVGFSYIQKERQQKKKRSSWFH